jgi:hypothetical protein
MITEKNIENKDNFKFRNKDYINFYVIVSDFMFLISYRSYYHFFIIIV